MSKHRRLILLAGLILTTAVFPSCKKEKDASRAGVLAGSWKIMKQGMDDNNNGSWEPSEQLSAMKDYETEVVFGSDGKGSTTSYMGMITTIPFTWTLINDDNAIRYVCDHAGSTETSEETIVSMGFDELITRRNNGQTTSYSLLRRK